MFLLFNKNQEGLEFQGSLKDCYDYRLENLDEDYSILELKTDLVSEYLGNKYGNFVRIQNDDITVKDNIVYCEVFYDEYIDVDVTIEKLHNESLSICDIVESYYNEII